MKASLVLLSTTHHRFLTVIFKKSYIWSGCQILSKSKSLSSFEWKCIILRPHATEKRKKKHTGPPSSLGLTVGGLYITTSTQSFVLAFSLFLKLTYYPQYDSVTCWLTRLPTWDGLTIFLTSQDQATDGLVHNCSFKCGDTRHIWVVLSTMSWTNFLNSGLDRGHIAQEILGHGLKLMCGCSYCSDVQAILSTQFYIVLYCL